VTISFSNILHHGASKQAKPEGRDHVKDLGVDWKILERLLGEKGWEVVDWIHLAQDREDQ
jgi:hypothetical protein